MVVRLHVCVVFDVWCMLCVLYYYSMCCIVYVSVSCVCMMWCSMEGACASMFSFPSLFVRRMKKNKL